MITVVAEDLDNPGTDNAVIRYMIISQEPATPPDLFSINSNTGTIIVDSTELDREVRLLKYKSPVLACFHT